MEALGTGAPLPLTFREFVTRVNPRFRWYRHARRLARVLQRVADGELRRVMVFMPPRHGKSEEVSRLFSAYYLYRHPRRWVGLCSYGAELAFTLSRNARANYEAIGRTVSGAAGAVKHWETGQGGGMWAAGVGGPITGKGFHLGIVDDPVKNDQEAASPVIQERNREWWQSTFYTREEPDGAIVVLMTRWNENDLAGWLLSEERSDDGEPERWHVVNMPAIYEGRPTQDAAEHRLAGDDLRARLTAAFGNTSPTLGEFPASVTLEPDWRKPGEALCPERRDLVALSRIRRVAGPYYWAALYQQRPGPREGTKFKRAWFAVADPSAVPRRFRHIVRFWDLASTDGDGDFTAGVKMGLDFQDMEWVLDVIAVQLAAGERDRLIRQTAVMDGAQVHQWGQQDPGSAGKDAATDFRRQIAALGRTVNTEPVSGDKLLRMDPLASAAHAGRITLVRAPWTKATLDHLAAIGSGGAHDDVADAMAGAHMKLTAINRAAASEFQAAKK